MTTTFRPSWTVAVSGGDGARLQHPSTLSPTSPKRETAFAMNTQTQETTNGRTEGQGPSAQDRYERSGSFVTVAGLRSKRIAFNSETVDITDADSAGRWRELLAGSGVQRAAISGSGIFKDAQSDATMRSRFFAGEIADWQLAVPRFRHGRRGRSRSPRSNIPAATTAR